MVKNCLLELEKFLIEMKDIELKDGEIKIKREIVSVDNMDMDYCIYR